MGTIDFPENRVTETALEKHQNVGPTKTVQKCVLRDHFRLAVVGICDWKPHYDSTDSRNSKISKKSMDLKDFALRSLCGSLALDLAETALGDHQNVGSTKKPQKCVLRHPFQVAVVGICDSVPVGVVRVSQSCHRQYPRFCRESLWETLVSASVDFQGNP